MGTSRRAVRGNGLSRVVFGLSAVLLAFAPPAARPWPSRRGLRFPDLPRIFRALRRFDLQADRGADHGQNRNRRHCDVPGGGLYVSGHSRSVDCQLGRRQHARLLRAAEPDTIWSTYQPRPNIPQALTNWVPTLPEAAAPPLFCPKSLGLGNQLVNCFSFLCDSQTYINNVPVVTCHCPIGESLAGTPVPPHTAFLTQAGQGDEATCAMYPVSGPISLP